MFAGFRGAHRTQSRVSAVKVGSPRADSLFVAKGKGKGKVGADGVIDVEVVADSAAPVRGPKLGIATVAKPCLIGAVALTLIGAVLPH